MATPEHIRHELLDRLDRAGPNGVAQSLFLRTVSFALSELRLSALASGPITLRVELEPGIEPDGAMLEANLAAALAAAPIGPTGERRLDIDAAMF